MAGRPFIAFEWGSEVVYALAYRAAGLAGVAVLSGLVLALTYALVARFLIRRGGDPLLAYFVSMVAAVLSAAHWLARPHLFTMLAVVLLLELLERRGRRTLWPYFVLFVVWTNLHGGFFYGCITIAIYAVGELLEARFWLGAARAEWIARARHHLAALGVAILASLVNPNGFRNLAHVTGFFGNRFLRQTQEFLSPDFHTINGKIFLLALLAVMAILAFTRRRPTLPVLLVLLANVAFSLISQRNIELFALVALPLLALTYDEEWRALPLLRRAKEMFQREHAGAYSGVAAGICALLLLGRGLRWRDGRRSGGRPQPDSIRRCSRWTRWPRREPSDSRGRCSTTSSGVATCCTPGRSSGSSSTAAPTTTETSCSTSTSGSGISIRAGGRSFVAAGSTRRWCRPARGWRTSWWTIWAGKSGTVTLRP